MNRTSPALGRLFLIAAAVLFSTGGAAIKATTLTGWQVAGLRSAIATLALLALVPESRRGWSWRVWPVAAAYAGTLVLFVVANKLTTSANAIFLQSTAPVYLLAISPLFLHERIRRTEILLTIPVLAGLVLFFLGTEAPTRTAANPAVGNILAAITGLTWAITLTGLRWMGKRQGGASGALAMVVAGNIIAFLVVLPEALPMPPIGLNDALTLLYLGVFQIGLAYVCLARGVRVVPAFEASLLLLLEPALNPVWSWIVHGEQPAPMAIAGGALIMGATALSTWRPSGR